MTDAWTKLRYHKEQCRLWRTEARIVAVAAGRGSGKTELARRRVVRFLSVKKAWPDPMYFYALPTYNQARRVAWKKIKQLVPPAWTKNGTMISEGGMVINTIFGSSLYIVGMDKPQRIEGDQWDGGVIDESCDQKPGIFDLNVAPALTHREAWCWRIGVPKRSGPGAREFKNFFYKQADEAFTWPSSDILTDEQLAPFKEKLDARDYSEQFEANWEEVGGLIFHAFSSVKNVTNRACYDPKKTIIIGSDFNVDPMSWIIGHANKGGMTIFDEIWKRNTNTIETLNILFKRYGDHDGGFAFFGDATGRARKSSASKSDYVHIKNDDRFKRKRVYYLRSNPRVADRFSACNAMFCNAKGERRCFIHPRCEHLIEDLSTRAYKQGSNEADDYGDVGHMTDALGYPIWRLFPMRVTKELADAPEVYLGDG